VDLLNFFPKRTLPPHPNAVGRLGTKLPTKESLARRDNVAVLMESVELRILIAEMAASPITAIVLHQYVDLKYRRTTVLFVLEERTSAAPEKDFAAILLMLVELVVNMANATRPFSGTHLPTHFLLLLPSTSKVHACGKSSIITLRRTINTPFAVLKR
jgi:hypothetical protein